MFEIRALLEGNNAKNKDPKKRDIERKNHILSKLNEMNFENGK